jgi:hypothetical protein
MLHNPLTDPGNHPERFNDLTSTERDALIEWIEENLIQSKRFYMRFSSYQFRGYFERRPGGFYVCNGAFKGAMLNLGFRVKDPKEVNWNFNISPKSPLFFRHEELRKRNFN